MLGARDDPLEQVAPVVVDSRSLSRQLAERLRQMVGDGTLPAWTQLPTEEQFARHFRVGRTTVREALKELESEGTVVVRRGRGRFVSGLPSLRFPITRLESVTAMLKRHGYDVESRVVNLEISPGRPDEIAQLQLQPEDEVVRLCRIRYQGDDPLIYSQDVFPNRLIVGSEGINWTGSLLEILSSRGVVPVTSVTTIRATTLPPEIADVCGLNPTLPFLLMVQLNLTAEGVPVIYSHDYHRGDRFSFDLLRRAELGSAT